MEELLSCHVLQVSDGSLSDAVLEVGINSAKSESLSLPLARCFECVVGKPSIVGMVVEDGDAMITSVLLESQLCIDCFLRRQIAHQMNKTKS